MTVLTPLTDKDYDGLKRILRSLQVCSIIANIYISVQISLLENHIKLYYKLLIENLSAINVIIHI